MSKINTTVIPVKNMEFTLLHRENDDTYELSIIVYPTGKRDQNNYVEFLVPGDESYKVE